MDDPVRLWCDDLDEAVGALQGLGVRLDVIRPADSPRVAELSGGGRRIRLERRPDAPPPDAGRAGMVYRDLLPGRGGGRFIASHITIRDGGPVPDYVHHHAVRFQIVHCVRGWVRVVYEEQGPPFVMEAGDTVLQPPHIRHRVLESSPGLEVLEFTSPADHPTIVDHDLPLPTADLRADRDFSGQRFVCHQMSTTVWANWRPGFEVGETGIDAASGDLVDARTIRVTEPGSALAPARHDAEVKLWYVEDGSVTWHCGETTTRLDTGDAIAVPAGVDHSLRDCTADLRFFEVTVSTGVPQPGRDAVDREEQGPFQLRVGGR